MTRNPRTGSATGQSSMSEQASTIGRAASLRRSTGPPSLSRLRPRVFTRFGGHSRSSWFHPDSANQLGTLESAKTRECPAKNARIKGGKAMRHRPSHRHGRLGEFRRVCQSEPRCSSNSPPTRPRLPSAAFRTLRGLPRLRRGERLARKNAGANGPSPARTTSRPCAPGRTRPQARRPARVARARRQVAGR